MATFRVLTCVLAVAVASPAAAAAAEREPPWEEVLGPPRGEIPPPPPPAKLEWLNGTEKALQVARREDRPSPDLVTGAVAAGRNHPLFP